MPSRLADLSEGATQIIAKIREWLSELLRWTTYQHQLNVGIIKSLGALAGPVEQGSDAKVVGGSETGKSEVGTDPPDRKA